MGLPKQGCQESLFDTQAVHDMKEDPAACADRHAGAVRRTQGVLAAVVAAIAFLPLHSMAAGNDSVRRLTEDELSRIAARGLSDRYFDKISRYLSHGVAVEVLGDMGTLLNPLPTLLDADTSYKDVVYNPVSPWMVIDGNGTGYVRLPASIGEINIRNIRVLGSNGTSYGSVTIRDVNFNGTTIRITKR